MCGIAGWLNEGARDVGNVLARLGHRGPDGEASVEVGQTVAGGPSQSAVEVHLLHTRLSIIDLSAAGTQPMRDPATGNVITFNGEIYNFRSLRDELAETDDPWLSHSDTEVILRAWRRWGLDCLTRLRGMFAFALWDAASRKVFLARDRFGIKPLYFARRGRTVGFASEVRAILAMGILDGRVDPQRVAEFLRWQSAVGAGTLIEGIEMVPAGGVLEVSEDGDVRAVAVGMGETLTRLASRGTLSQRERGGGGGASRRDDCLADPSTSLGMSGGASGEVVEGIRDSFDEAVRLHLEADVPVGGFLSGGLDSTAIVGTLAHLGVRAKTFTVCWEGGDDESVAARRAAELAGAEHHEVRLTEAEVLARVPEAVEKMDSPSADGVNSYVVSWAVRQQGLKVALSGLGGDELFGGYPSFRRVQSGWARLLGSTPRVLRAPFGAGAGAIGGFSTKLGKLEDLLRGGGSLTDVYLEGRALFSERQVAELIPRLSALGSRPSVGVHPCRDLLLGLEKELGDQVGTFVSHAEMMTYMHDTLLRDTDQMSMAHGLEVRVPFLDGVFAEGVLGLPDEVKLGPRPSALGPRQVVTKPLLVEAFSDRIPVELHSLPKKGFSLPMRRWMKGPLREYCLERIESDGLRDAGIDRKAARAVWKAFEDDRARWSRAWALVVLGDWVGRNG